MSSDVLLEEFEVLESIYPDEFTRLSERIIKVDVEPEDIDDNDSLKLSLTVEYTDGYPDTLPLLSLEPLDGELDEAETVALIESVREVGEENAGMAMTFTIVSHLREQISNLIRERHERRRKEDMEKERKVLEEEESRTRGTPVTVSSFSAWKVKFDQELALKKAREDDEKMKGLSLKEREEYKKLATRLSGRQLFERDKDLAISDSTLEEEGLISVDIRQYERPRELEDEDETDRVHFSDSD